MHDPLFMFNSYIRRSVPNNDRILLRFVRRHEVSKIQCKCYSKLVIQLIYDIWTLVYEFPKICDVEIHFFLLFKVSDIFVSFFFTNVFFS